MPAVSVLIPTHGRRAATLPFAVASVQAQGIDDIEILIVGDGVDDPVRSTVERLRSADAYVFQVAANLLKDRARRSKVRADFAAAEAPPDEVEEFETRSSDPERIEAARRSLAALVARLRELPERTREIFILYRIENVARRDIAQAYGLSLSTVEKEIARATAYLMLHRENSQ